jgi:hypothetical protein
MAINAKPDDLHKLLGSSERHYSRMTQKMGRNKDVYYQRQQVYATLPDGVVPFRSSRGTGVVDDLAEQINLFDPVVTARSFGTSQAAMKSASVQRRWGEQLLMDARVQIGQGVKDMTMMGAGAIKWLLNPVVASPVAHREDETDADHELRMSVHEKQIAHEPVFIVHAIDPMNLFPGTSRGRLQYVLERQERRALDMWEQYPNWEDSRAKKFTKAKRENPLRTVEWLEYWSWMYTGEQWEGWYIVEVDHDRIIEVRNPYMHVPYSFEFSGMGRIDSSGDPETQAMSILDKLDGDLEAEVRLKTAADLQWQYHVLPRLKVKGVSAQDAAKMMNAGPGGVVEIPPNGEFEWMDVVPPTETMLNFIHMVDIAIDRRVNPALSGQNTADYGIQQALQLGQAMKAVTDIRGAANKMGEAFLSGAATIMSSYNLKMDIHGTNQKAEPARMVKGNDFKRFSFSVSYEATDPTEDQRKMLALLSVVREPDLLSNETFRKHVLSDIIEDEEEEEARILAEKIISQMVDTGQLMQLVMQRSEHLAKGTEMEEQIKQQAAETAAIAGGVVQGAGGPVPGGPGGPGGAVPPGAGPPPVPPGVGGPGGPGGPGGADIPDRAALVEAMSGAGSIADADNVGQNTLSQQV